MLCYFLGSQETDHDVKKTTIVKDEIEDFDAQDEDDDALMELDESNV